MIKIEIAGIFYSLPEHFETLNELDNDNIEIFFRTGIEDFNNLTGLYGQSVTFRMVNGDTTKQAIGNLNVDNDYKLSSEKNNQTVEYKAVFMPFPLRKVNRSSTHE